MATRDVPLIRKPRDYYGDELSSRRRSTSNPRRRPRQPSSIPPTTNVRAVERRFGAQLPSALPQTSVQISQPDVRAIMAVWEGSGVSTRATWKRARTKVDGGR